MWWIYGLVDPAEPEMVRYVGVTHQRPIARFRQHLCDALVKNSPYPRNLWIRKVERLGRTVQMVLIEFGDTVSGWADRERYWIKIYKQLYPGRNLNAAAGGHSNSGCIMPDSQRQATSKRMKGYRPTEETRHKQSLSRLGMKLPAEQVRKMAASKICTIATDEIKRKRSQHRIGKPLPPEVIEKIKHGEWWQKLDLDKAREIRRRRIEERLSMTELGNQYGVSSATINSILKDRHYQEAPDMRLRAIRNISDEQATEIKLLNSKGISQCKLAKTFSVSRRAISYILIDNLTKKDSASKGVRS